VINTISTDEWPYHRYYHVYMNKAWPNKSLKHKSFFNLNEAP